MPLRNEIRLAVDMPMEVFHGRDKWIKVMSWLAENQLWSTPRPGSPSSGSQRTGGILWFIFPGSSAHGLQVSACAVVNPGRSICRCLARSISRFHAVVIMPAISNPLRDIAMCCIFRSNVNTRSGYVNTYSGKSAKAESVHVRRFSR